MLIHFRRLVDWWDRLNGPSELHLSPTVECPRVRSIPFAMYAHVLLTPVLLSAVAIAATILSILAVCFVRENLPTDWQLLLAKQTTQGVVDVVTHQPGRAGSGKVSPTPPRWTYKYHFTTPAGQIHYGECDSALGARRKNAQVVVEYHPRNPDLNRIQGMQASGQSWGAFITAAFLMSVVAMVQQLYHACRAYRLIRSGIFGTATLTHCFPKASTWELEWGGIKRTKVYKGSEVPWEEFQRQAWERQRGGFDAAGRYCGTPQLRGLYLAIAALLGAILFAMLGFAFSLLRFGAPNPWWILAAAVSGALGLSVVESRFRILLRSSNKQQLGDLPVEFKNALCMLQIHSQDGTLPASIQRTMPLVGNATDARPMEVLYPAHRPQRAMLIEELGLIGSKAPEGTTILYAPPALNRLLALLAIPPVVALAALVAWWN